MKYSKLKTVEELNLSALGRSAKIRGNKLTQAVGGYPYKDGRVRKLTEDEQSRLLIAIKRLTDKLLKLIQ